MCHVRYGTFDAPHRAFAVVPYRTVPFCSVPCGTVRCLGVPSRNLPYRVVPCGAVPYRAVPYRTVLCRTVLYRTVPCCTGPYHIALYGTVPYRTIPYTVYTMPYCGYRVRHGTLNVESSRKCGMEKRTYTPKINEVIRRCHAYAIVLPLLSLGVTTPENKSTH